MINLIIDIIGVTLLVIIGLYFIIYISRVIAAIILLYTWYEEYKKNDKYISHTRAYIIDLLNPFLIILIIYKFCNDKK